MYALADGSAYYGMLAYIGSAESLLLAGLGSIAPFGWAAIGVVTLGIIALDENVFGNEINTISYSASKSKEKDDVDPYARAGQKKQGREVKSKSRQKENFNPRNNKRDKKPAKPKKHTPSRRGHTKFYPNEAVK